jgi:hypothetical protein
VIATAIPRELDTLAGAAAVRESDTRMKARKMYISSRSLQDCKSAWLALSYGFATTMSLGTLLGFLYAQVGRVATLGRAVPVSVCYANVKASAIRIYISALW